MSNAPSPAQRVGDQTADRGADRRPGTEDDVQIALPEAAVTQGDEIGQQDGGDGVDAAAADAGNGSRGDELRDVAAQATAQRPEAKKDIGKEEALLSAKDVAQLAVQRLTARQSEEVAAAIVLARARRRLRLGEVGRVVILCLEECSRRRDPAGAVQGVQVAAHAGICRDDEGLVKGA